MTRAYVAAKRQLAPIVIKVTPPDPEQIALLADTFMRAALEDGSGILDVFKQFTDYELLDVLREELKRFPISPVSMEVKRLMRKHYKNMARKVAREILIGD